MIGVPATRQWQPGLDIGPHAYTFSNADNVHFRGQVPDSQADDGPD